MAHVLVVDDDATIRRLLTFAFSMEGHTVETLEDGRGVLEALRRSAERMIVFMDIMMPYVDGLTVCHQIAEEPDIVARNVVVLMTAGAGPDLAQTPHVRDWLAKPFDLGRLLGLVERLSAELMPVEAPADTGADVPERVSAL